MFLYYAIELLISCHYRFSVEYDLVVITMDYSKHISRAGIKSVATCLENIELLWTVMLGTLVDLEE